MDYSSCAADSSMPHLKIASSIYLRRTVPKYLKRVALLSSPFPPPFKPWLKFNSVAFRIMFSQRFSSLQNFGGYSPGRRVFVFAFSLLLRLNRPPPLNAIPIVRLASVKTCATNTTNNVGASTQSRLTQEITLSATHGIFLADSAP